MLGIPFPELPRKGSRAEMFNLGACHDESPRISLVTLLHGVSHLAKQHERPNKLQFAVIPGTFPFLTPPFHIEPLGLGACGCSPKTPWLVPQPLCTRAVQTQGR